MKYKKLYIAATSQHVGKTTSTLGLISRLKNMGINVGYCKPVGQKFVEVENGRVDKDAVLFAKFMNFQIDPAIHSPAILGRGTTAKYLENPDAFRFREDILKAAEELKQRHEVVIYEGTGHPGVGSVVDLSNADVAKMLGAGVIMVIEGGIGSTLDRLALSCAIFEQQNVPIVGVIVNKVRKNKLQKVEKYVGGKIKKMGLNLLGIIPYEEDLEYPLMITVVGALKAEVLYNAENLDNQVEEVIAGSLIDLNELKSFQNLLLVVSVHRLSDALKKLQMLTKIMGIRELRLAGIILTGKGEIEEEHKEYFVKSKVPVLLTNLDTYGAIMTISKIEVKINVRTQWKVLKAVSLFKKHIDLETLFPEVAADN